ncbi:hypothetical protein HN709_02380 [Candidatus Peregrinibacteria bacterium]|jgi:hypothetical protein|nr:hypothetical protein [Candidatus Peregrinibacteria bacterium]MBT7736509.1 hypothetical protein [Candidatus Peregrinibacteria bacterium]
MPNSFKHRLKKLALSKKFVFFGSILAILGTFLPWYKDFDKFNTGDMYIGLSGPLYLAGLIVLLAAAGSFSVVLTKLLQKPTPKLPLKEDYFHILNSGLSLFMLVMSLSVFFHPKFGVNVIDKTIGIGMMFAFIGSGLVLLGSVMAIKKQDVSFEDEGHLDPLIDLEKQERMQQDLNDGPHAVHEESDKVKSAVQDSIEEFTESAYNTNDITPND